ncbi:hypothetical protein [Parasitella parasitica]|uniref:CYK3 C-terminal Ig-like domain-containing protein n=1 Tax=Parasitella parasitica TaxID=35722 RepID=A0A0B7NKL7_9FUNG|nr:hypothetical protein [Parasitella parasitica]
MNGVFLRQSVSTPYTAAKKNRPPSDIHLYPCREPIDMSLNYSSSSSSSSSDSRNGYSPPLPTDTPMQQRIQRKPVVSNPMVRSYPDEKPLVWKMVPPAPAVRTNLKKNYAAADTVHPNRIRNSTQIAPGKQPAKLIPSSSAILSSKEKRSRTRCQSQGSNLASSNAAAATPFYTAHDDELKSTATLATSTIISTATSNVTKSSSFWYPRTEHRSEPLKPLKRGLSKKIRGLLQPHRMQIEQGASNEQHIIDCQESLKRCQTPVLDDDENPFRILSHTCDVSLKYGALQFNEADFAQIDSYASTVQQRGPLLTPAILSQKFLVRPYRKDLLRLRALFIWVVQNIRPDYHQRRNDLLLLQKQQNQQQLMQQQQQQQNQVTQPVVPSKSSNIRKRLSRIGNSDDSSAGKNPNEITAQKLDAMNLLQEEAISLMSETMISSDYMEESAEAVLDKRSCKSSFGMARLFVAMALAAGFEDARVVMINTTNKHSLAPKDTVAASESKLPLNHAWCSVKIEDEYRLIDCWLASPFHPQNENKMESHWFLSKPHDMIMSHFPKNHHDQYLNPPLSSYAFFLLPYIRNPFFRNGIRFLKYHVQLQENEHSVFYVKFTLSQTNISCYAETESDDGTATRGLAQCITDDHENRICKVKAVLPPHQTSGWLKIYAGPKAEPVSSSGHHHHQQQQQQQQQEVVNKNHYPLALCIRISTQQPTLTPFDFVQLYVDHNEFYIQEPQCYQFYPLQTYHFRIRANRLDYRATHHKLAVKSPSGKLVKLTYYPQEQTYDGTVTVSEAGKWSLICLLHHTGGSYTVASWSCKLKK